MERVIAAKVELQGRSREIEGEEVEVEGVLRGKPRDQVHRPPNIIPQLCL